MLLNKLILRIKNSIVIKFFLQIIRIRKNNFKKLKQWELKSRSSILVEIDLKNNFISNFKN